MPVRHGALEIRLSPEECAQYLASDPEVNRQTLLDALAELVAARRRVTVEGWLAQVYAA